MIIHLLSISILVTLLRWVASDIIIEKRKKKNFIYCILLTIIITAAELGCLLTDNTFPENRRLCLFFNTLGFSLTPFVFLVESDIGKAKKRVLYYLPSLINLVLSIASPRHGWIFFVGEDCTYQRGSFFFIYLIAFLYSVFFSLGKKLFTSRNYPAYFHKRIIENGILLFIGIMIQVIFPQYHTTWITTTFYLVLYYTLSCEMGSMMDGVTGLLNRVAFNKVIEHLELSPKRNIVLFMIDVNDFKDINDVKGHTSGDYYLKEIGKILEKVFSFNAQIYRFGGDEFCVILIQKPNDRTDYAGKLVSLIKNRQQEDPDFPDVALGYSNFEAGKNVSDIINLADNNMYQNKRINKRTNKNTTDVNQFHLENL